MKRLTIGMAVYDDYDGVYFSVQAIRLYHPEILERSDLLVVDNQPESAAGKATAAFLKRIGGRYETFTEWQGTTVKNQVFTIADTDYVLCMDCHVFFPPGSLQYLLHYLDFRGNDKDLIQGPLIDDNFKVSATHQDANWRSEMWGTWARQELSTEPVVIPQQGTGVMACTKAAWPGFNPRFRGFGGEEGYIHEKIRQQGGQVICLPDFKWMHRFNRPAGIPYRCQTVDKFRNYLIGLQELKLDLEPVLEHFKEKVPADAYQRVLDECGIHSTPQKSSQYVLL
jgi:hypothetical protein